MKTAENICVNGFTNTSQNDILIIHNKARVIILWTNNFLALFVLEIFLVPIFIVKYKL